MLALGPGVIPARSSGSSALVTRLVPSTLTSNMRAQSSGSPCFDAREAERAARVVDEGVHGAEPADEVAQGIHVGLFRDVGDEHVGTGLSGECLEAVGPTGDAHDAPAVLTEQANRRRPYTRTGTCHNHSTCISWLKSTAGRVEQMTAATRADRNPEEAGSVLGQRPLRLRALVVIGHGIQRLTYDSDNALVVYLFIYAFHMPAFAMISGYFSKASPPSSRQVGLAVPEALIAVAGAGRWIYTLGYFNHVLYQYDCETGKHQSITVGAVGGHISRNFFCDIRGHAYVPRLARRPRPDDDHLTCRAKHRPEGRGRDAV